MGWRLRLLAVLTFIGCLALMSYASWLSSAPTVNAQWQLHRAGELMLVASPLPELKEYVGHTLRSVHRLDGKVVDLSHVTASAPRWMVSDTGRLQQGHMWRDLNVALSQSEVILIWDNGAELTLSPQPGSLTSLPGLFWLLGTLALLLYVVGMVVVVSRPSTHHVLFALIAVFQAFNLVLQGSESRVPWGLPQAFIPLRAWLPMVLDLCTGAAMVHAVLLYPRRLSRAHVLTCVVWMCVGISSWLLFRQSLPGAWWWVQISCGVAALIVIGMLCFWQRRRPHPIASVLLRFAGLGLMGWSLLTLLIALGPTWSPLQHKLTPLLGTAWYVFFSCLLLVLPFVSQAQVLIREFTLLALVSATATILDLGFVALFSFSPFTSLSLALFLSLGIYIGARQWIMDRVRGNQMHTTERMFGQLYRIARAVEAHPEHTANLLSQLLRQLFDPMEASFTDRSSGSARVVDGGSTLVVPVPVLGPHHGGEPYAIMLRHAHRGRSLFHSEDAVLADSIVDQLRRAVTFDRAVEQGRSEERTRLAQDLHDDIGARLLTMMYQASTPEMEAYVRHTLQDLKTLTRGLSVANQCLSHAAAEWKSDLSQRFRAADITLQWRLEFDEDLLLSVVQWSALTRVLRELASNVMSHAQAHHVEIELYLRQNQLRLVVKDDGTGKDPSTWAHGLGLGGVRKRIKQLGGTVVWRERAHKGIACEVVIDRFGGADHTAFIVTEGPVQDEAVPSSDVGQSLEVPARKDLSTSC